MSPIQQPLHRGQAIREAGAPGRVSALAAAPAREGDDRVPSRPHHLAEQAKLRGLPWVLVSSVFTSVFISWSYGGAFFLLFLHELGLPKGQIGILLSLLPFSGLLALVAAPSLAHRGWKRVFLGMFGARTLMTATLALLPWLFMAAGRGVALGYLVVVVCVFAILRALGETAYYPWYQYFVPHHLRGRFGGLSMLVSVLATSAAVLIAGAVIGAGGALSRFLLLLLIGCGLGLLGVIAMRWVPGGEPQEARTPTHVHWAQMAGALRDRNFAAYLGGFGAVTVGTLLLTSFLPLFVREQLGVVPGKVLMLDTATLVGMGASSLLWGRLADRWGSRAILLPAVGCTGLIPLGWLLLPREVATPVVWCGVLYLAYGVGACGVSIGATRLLFNRVVPEAQTTAYTAIYYALAGLTAGSAPLLAGLVLAHAGARHRLLGPYTVDAYTGIFLAALCCLGVGLALFARVRSDTGMGCRERQEAT
jgi:MFS family permease